MTLCEILLAQSGDIVIRRGIVEGEVDRRAVGVEMRARSLSKQVSEVLVFLLELLAGWTLGVVDIAGAVVGCEGLRGTRRRRKSTPTAGR